MTAGVPVITLVDVEILSGTSVALVDWEQPKSRRLMVVKENMIFVGVVGECRGMDNVNYAESG